MHFLSGNNDKSHFAHLRDLARKELSDYMEKYSGSKALVWDESLTGPLGLISEYQFLKDRGVVKMVPLTGRSLPNDNNGTAIENIVFIARPDVSLMDKIADSVKAEENQGSSRRERMEFHILFLPRKSLLCEMRLKDKGVYGSFTFLDELSTNWFPVESDVITMENGSLFADYYLNDDPTCLHSVAKSMMALQAITGFIPKVYGKGKAAKQVFEYMTRMRKEMLGNEPLVIPQVDTLILLDRQVDLLTPLATQLTYEGLIDEIFGIRHSIVNLPSEKFSTSDVKGQVSAPQESKQMLLNSGDELYAELRDKNFNSVGPTLNRKAKWISSQLDERHDAKSVKELRSFVERLPQMQAMKQSLAHHTSIAELIKEWTKQPQFMEFLQVEQELMNHQNSDKFIEAVEDGVCQDYELIRILRILCIQSYVTSGLKPKILESYRRLILQNYGYQHLISLLNLESAGLLRQTQPGNRSNYAVLRKRLNLTLDDVDEQNPKDIAYTYSVYAPISVRLIQHLSLSPGGWRSIRDVLDVLPGPTVEEKQPLNPSLKKSQNNNKNHNNPREEKTTLVLFIGGVTFAEISALRFLSQQDDSSTDYLIAATSIINGNNFIKSLMTQINEGAPF